MFAKTITYTDYNGVEKTKKFLFNLTKSELLEMELGTDGGFADTVQSIIDAKDQPSLIKIFKKFILQAYGEKSADGERFEKSEEISRAFSQTPAYDILYMELSTNAEKAAEFINGVVPPELSKQAQGEIKALTANASN